MLKINNLVFKKVYDNTWGFFSGDEFKVFTEHLVFNISEENDFKKGLAKIVEKNELEYLVEEFERDFFLQQDEEDFEDMIYSLKAEFLKTEGR